MTIHRIRLSKMQKIVNVLAVASAAVSLAVVGASAFVYVQRDAIIDNVKSQVQDAVLGGLGVGGVGVGGGLGGSLPTGATDLSPQTNPSEVSQQAAAPAAPVSPF